MTDPATAPTSVQRFLSLDVLRGLTITFMIMVNNNGGDQAGPRCTTQHGTASQLLTLSFPPFCLSWAFQSSLLLKRGWPEVPHVPSWPGIRRAQRDSVSARHRRQQLPLLPLGAHALLRSPATDAICYLLVSLFYLWDRRAWTKVAALAVVLLGYWVLVRWVPVPGAGMPVRDIHFLDTDQNIVAWLDRQLMPNHLYEDYITHNVRDPEGLLSDIPALGTALLGLLTGLWLRSRRDLKTRALGLVSAAAACLASGYLWSIWFPLNKKMWTSTFVLVAAGWSLAIFAFAYWAVEIKGGESDKGRVGQPFGPGSSSDPTLSQRTWSASCSPASSTASLQGQRPQVECTWVGACQYLRPDPQPRLGLLCLLVLLMPPLFHPGMDPLPQKDLHQGVSRASIARAIAVPKLL